MKLFRTLVAAVFALTLLVSQALAADTLKIGAILSETGPASFLGAPEARTLRMMVDEMNAQGGMCGKQVELLVMDSGGSPEKASSFAKQLIEEEKVFAIIGPSTSGETMSLKPLVEKARTLMISCAAAEDIVNPVAKYVFKTPQKDSDAARMIFMQMKKMGIKKIGVTAGNTGFGKAGMAQLKELAPEYGIEIVIAEVYDKASTDLTAIVTKLKAANVEAVVNWSIVPAQAIIAKNMRQIGMTVPLFQSHGFGNLDYVTQAGAAAEGIIFPAGRLLVADQLPAGHPQKALLTKYKKDYEGKYGGTASTFGGHAYDAMLVLKAAVKKAGGCNPDKVRDAMEGLKGVEGTAGIFNFSPTDHNGLTIDSFEMLTVKGGKFVILGK